MDAHAALSDIIAAYRAAANPANAAPMAAYMKHRFPFLGVKAPERKVMEREIFAQHNTAKLPEIMPLLRRLYHQPEREFHYLAVAWLQKRSKEFSAAAIADLRYFITTHSWWDTVDSLASHGLADWCQQFPERWHETALTMTQSDNLWLQRAAIIHQLFYKAQTDTDLLEMTIQPHIRSKEFFLQKAIGWALRQYAKTDADWVRDFAEAHPLAPLSRREALKHA